MALVKVEITLGKGESATTRLITIDPDELPMGFNEDIQEAGESGKHRELNQVFAEMIGMTHAEFRQVKQGDFKRIMAAIKAAQEAADEAPNG